MFLTTVLILVLIVLEDWFLTFCAEFYDTWTYLFDVSDGIILHPMHHVVLEVGTEAYLTTDSE